MAPVPSWRLVVAGITLSGIFVPGLGSTLLLDQGEPPVNRCPVADFNPTYGGANDTLPVEHVGGDRLSGRVSVVITDEETDATESMVWVSEESDARLHVNDSVAIADRVEREPVRAPWVSLDLDEGDPVQVRWDAAGKESDCPRTVLDEFTVE